jgi:MFS family permease
VLISAYFPETGFSAGDVGLLIAVSGMTFVAGGIPLGILADRKGRKWILLIGMAITTPAIMVFAFTRDMGWLLFASFIAGLSEGAFMATWNALIADQTGTHNRNAAFSLSFIVGTVAFGLGFALPIMFPTIESAMGWDSESVHMMTLILLGLVSASSPVAVWWLLRDYKEEVREWKKYTWGPSMRRLLKFSGINSLIGLGAGFIIPLIPTWLLLRFDIQDSVSGPLLALASITMGVGAIGSAYLAKKHGMVRAIVMTSSLSTIFMFSLAFIPNAALAAAFYLVRAALMNMGVPLLDSFLMGIISKEERGLASAINSVIWRLPNSASTVVGGMLLAEGIYDIPFFLATGFYVTALVLFYAVFKDVKPST